MLAVVMPDASNSAIIQCDDLGDVRNQLGPLVDVDPARFILDLRNALSDLSPYRALVDDAGTAGRNGCRPA